MGVFQNNLLAASAAAASAGGGGFYSYQIENSCRLDRDSNSYLRRTQGTPSSTTTFTWSMWLKRHGPIPASAQNRKDKGELVGLANVGMREKDWLGKAELMQTKMFDMAWDSVFK